MSEFLKINLMAFDKMVYVRDRLKLILLSWIYVRNIELWYILQDFIRLVLWHISSRIARENLALHLAQQILFTNTMSRSACNHSNEKKIVKYIFFIRYVFKLLIQRHLQKYLFDIYLNINYLEGINNAKI